MTVFRDNVERAIRQKPGIAKIDLAARFKCDSKKITNALTGLKHRGINVVSKIIGNQTERKACYTIVDKNKLSAKDKTVSPSVVPNLFDKSGKSRALTDDQIIATFSDSDRARYFAFKSTGRFNMESAELLINVRRETLIQESEVPRVSIKV